MSRACAALALLLSAGCFSPSGDDSPRDASTPDSSVPDASLQCAACVPSCGGQACGDDGCGGSCGRCAAGQVCRLGACTEADDSFCASRDCGPDGMGGVCGSCPGGWSCNADGFCVPDGGCGSVPASGACVSGNVARCEAGAMVHVACPYRNCRVDPASGRATCGEAPCIPNCFGRGCGDDGCGGSCGTCLSDETCNTDLGVCFPPCSRVPTAGMCQGTALIACVGGRMEKTSCLAFDQICDPTTCSSAVCRPLRRGTPCMGLSSAGLCDGEVLYVCSGGEVVTQRCAEDGQRCARVAVDRYSCVR